MKRYLIIGDGESPHILKWARELNKHFEVYLVSSRNLSPEIKTILPEDRVFTFDLKISETGGNFKFLWMIFPLTRIIKRIKPDFVNAHYITSHGFVTALARKFSRNKFKLIQSAWGTDILVTPNKSPFYKKITRFALKQSSLVTTDSLIVAEIVHQLCSTPTTTFPFGLDSLPEVTTTDKNPNLYFSNRTLNANSNIDNILHFFAKVHIKNPEARLVIANDGPLKDDLLMLTDQLGIRDVVTFVGFISAEKQNDLYRRSQYYFSVLTSDALSVSLIEALAFGCIPIVSDLPDNRDWIDDRVNGMILSKDSQYDDLLLLQKISVNILSSNRELVADRAIFPKAIAKYCNTISALQER